MKKSQKTTQIPHRIKQAIADNNLVLFIGAGLSSNFTNIKGVKIGNWTKLVDELIAYLQMRGYDLSTLHNNTEKGKEIEALQIIENNCNIPPFEIIDFASSFYALKESNDFTLQTKLLKLTNKIITTNYDNAFELSDTDKLFKIAYWGKDYELGSLPVPSESILFKLHGCIGDGSKMILMPSNYRNLYENKNEEAERILKYLENIIFSKQVLFIGCGLGDFQINNLFSFINKSLGKYNRQKPYILTRKQDFNFKLDFLEPIYIEEYSEIELYIDKFLEERELVSKKSLEGIVFKSEIDDLTNEAFVNAITYQTTQMHEVALKWYEFILKISPDHYDSLNNMGIICQELKYYSKAIEYYSRVIELNPKHFKALNNLGNVYDSIGQYEEALKYLKMSLELSPNQGHSYFNIGNTYYKFGHYNEAISFLRKAIDITPQDYQAYNTMGKAHESLDNYNEALRCFEKAIKINANYSRAYDNLGQLYQKTNKLEEALINYKKAIDLDPRLTDVLKDIAIVLVRLEKYDEAVVYYKKAIELDPQDAILYYNLGLTYYTLEEYLKSISYYKKAIDLDPNYTEALVKLGISYTHIGEYEKALQYFQEAKNVNPERISLSFNIASTYFNMKKYNKSIEMLDKIINIDPNYNDAYSILALCHLKLGNIALSEKYAKIYLDSQSPHK